MFNKRLVHFMNERVTFFDLSDYCDYSNLNYSAYSDYMYRFELKRAFQMNNGMDAARTSQSQSMNLETISETFLETHRKSTSRTGSHTIMHSRFNHLSKWMNCKSKMMTRHKHGAFLAVQALPRNKSVRKCTCLSGLNRCTPNWLSNLSNYVDYVDYFDYCMYFDY